MAGSSAGRIMTRRCKQSNGRARSVARATLDLRPTDWSSDVTNADRILDCAMIASDSVPDPRVFPDPHQASPSAAAVYRLAEESLRAQTRQQADRLDACVREALMTELAGDGRGLAELLAGAPSFPLARYLWRELDAAWAHAGRGQGETMAI